MENNSKGVPRHPIRVVSRRTGLTSSVLRAWERRYGVVQPTRTEGGQRLYSDADIERLALLHRATQAGRTISQVAKLSSDELANLVEEDRAATLGRTGGGARQVGQTNETTEYVDHAVSAIENLDSDRLSSVLRRAVVSLGVSGFTEDLLAPLLQIVGDRWYAGTLRPAHEHMASAVIRKVINWVSEAADVRDDAPRIVIGTPARERHELGALLAAVTAAAEGWRVTYLGIDLPPEDFVAAAKSVGAAAVGLSAVYPMDLDWLEEQIRRIRDQLPRTVSMVLGGAASQELGEEWEVPGVTRIPDLSSFSSYLNGLADSLRRPGTERAAAS